ncbi:MAG TPA: CoA pyrophosphatase [Candidatus Kapabacteria bacterium]|nr:CoA pyrophosphatase [Candidatus Kapabacteria bacterium]
MNFSIEFIEKLKDALNGELPGKSAHRQMNPLHLNPNFKKFVPDNETHKTAVLVLLFPNADNELCTLFTLRSDTLTNHSGEVSFPGGHLEGNENFVDAALRETFEEVGIPSENINVIGMLSPFYALPSDSCIQPIVAYTNYLDNLKLNPDEVQEAIIVPIEDLLNPDNLDNKVIEKNGRTIQIPYWKIHPERPLWGATAMIMNELLTIIKNIFSTSDIIK